MIEPFPREPAPLHATLVARFSRGGWRGVLVRGPSGSGKSTLALALIARGWRLVADDRVIAWASGGRAWGRSPTQLSDLMEVRSVGVVTVAALRFTEIVAVIEAAPGEAADRIPLALATELLGVAMPLGQLDLAAPSAPDRALAFCDALRL